MVFSGCIPRFFPPRAPLEVTQRLLLQFHLLCLLTFMISAKVCALLQLQVLSYTPLLLAEGDRGSASPPSSCSSQMLQWQAVIGWQIKEPGFPRGWSEKMETNPFQPWISRSSLTWLEMSFKLLPESEDVVTRTFSWMPTAPSLAKIARSFIWRHHHSIRDELGFI